MKNVRPPFTSFPLLKSHRISLRELQQSDLEELIEISFYDGTPAKDLVDAQIMNGRINLDYMEGNSIHWVISNPLNGKILGTCGFYRGFKNNIGEIGYVLKKEHQGQGYMAEALLLMLQFGWEELQLKAIKAITLKNNQASINVLNKAGLKLMDDIDEKILFLIRR